MYYHPQNEESKLPDITIRNFKVVRVLPTSVSVDSLYQKQLNLRLFNYDLMMGFTADTIRIDETIVEQTNSTATKDEKDSIALRTR